MDGTALNKVVEDFNSLKPEEREYALELLQNQVNEDFRKKLARKAKRARKDYLEGKTPLPCVNCNTFLKFDHLVRKMKELDCDYLATGHYAQILKDEKQHGRRFFKNSKKARYWWYFALWSLLYVSIYWSLFGYWIVGINCRVS